MNVDAAVTSDARSAVICCVESHHFRIGLRHAKCLVSSLPIIMANVYVLCFFSTGKVDTGAIVSAVVSGFVGLGRGQGAFVRCSSFRTATTIHRHLEVVNTNGPGSDAVSNISLETELQYSRSVPFIANFEPDGGLDVISVGIKPNLVFCGAAATTSYI